MLDKSLLYRYTVKEDVLNAISHGIGVIFSYWALSYLSYLSETTEQYIIAIFYTSALLIMFLSSTLYHAIFNDQTRGVFKRLDHSAIFLLITATYSPYIFLVIKTPLAYLTFGILVILTILGIILKVFYVGRFKKISTLIYVLMGWAVIFQVPDLIDTMDAEVLIYLAAGGVVYTVGAVFYAFAKFKYHHFIWHLFVFIAALLQFYSIYLIYK